MKFLKNIKLYLICINLLFTPIFSLFDDSSSKELTSFSTNSTPVNNLISAFKKSPDGVADFIDQEEEELSNPFFGSFNFQEDVKTTEPVNENETEKEKENRIKKNEAKTLRYSSSSTRRENKEKKDSALAKKQEEDKTAKDIIRKDSDVIENKINDMIQRRSANLTANQNEFLSLIENQLDSRLTEMYGVNQIESFRDVTKNFTDSSLLEPYAVLYLNACAKFYPIAQAMNEDVRTNPINIKNSDGSIDSINNFDFFHIFIGEMEYIDGHINSESIMKGGHLYIPTLTPQIRLFTSYQLNDAYYFNVSIKSIMATNRGIKTYYPYGQTPQECLNQFRLMVDDYNETQFMNNNTLDQKDNSSNIIKNIQIIGKDLNNIDIQIYIKSSGNIFYPVFKEE